MSEIELYQVDANENVWTLPLGFLRGDRFAKLPKDFNPESDEVIVVKKDARRVWVDKSGEDQWLHTSRPAWHIDDWVSPLLQVLPHRNSPEMEQDDLIEFVAVRTHRPPEPEKPVEKHPQTGDTTSGSISAGDPRPCRIPARPADGTPVAETDEQKVRSVYPYPCVKPHNRGWVVINDPGDMVIVSDWSPTPHDAWTSAVRIMEAAVPVRQHFPHSQYFKTTSGGYCISEDHSPSKPLTDSCHTILGAWKAAGEMVARVKPPVNADYFSSFVVDTRQA